MDRPCYGNVLQQAEMLSTMPPNIGPQQNIKYIIYSALVFPKYVLNNTGHLDVNVPAAFNSFEKC